MLFAKIFLAVRCSYVWLSGLSFILIHQILLGPIYAAPEILNFDAYLVDQADLWSLGVVLYQVCSAIYWRRFSTDLIW